jgi:pilus assembly protein CpaC
VARLSPRWVVLIVAASLAAPAAPFAEDLADLPFPEEPPMAESAADAAEPAGPMAELISLQPAEIRTLRLEDAIQRVAIGDPRVVDVALVSAKELLLKAVTDGTTNLIVWDPKGNMLTWNIEVIDRGPEELEAVLHRLLDELGVLGVSVKREGPRLFLTGEVPRKEDVDRLNEMLGAYGDVVTNLVTVPPPPEPVALPPPPTVKLTVQVIEMSRDSRDKFGVDWSDTLTFTETTFGPLDLDDEHSQAERLGQAFRLGALSRTGAVAVLNMLVSNGKARILAEPKLVASSGKAATTIIGVEVPVITTTSVSSGTVSQSIEFKQTGVELRFRPVVLDDEESIQLSLNAKVSSIDTASAITVQGIVVPGFRVRETETEIVTSSGESVFIAGLLQDEERKNLSQVPGIGSIPVLGRLFSSHDFLKGQTELVIVVTPELTAQAELTTDRALALEQALASSEVGAAVNNPTLRYAVQIQERIARALRYPADQADQGLDGRVRLRLHLFRDGSLGQAMVAETSGISALDTAALGAAEAGAPYPPFPQDFVQQDIWLEVPVLFRP